MSKVTIDTSNLSAAERELFAAFLAEVRATDAAGKKAPKKGKKAKKAKSTFAADMRTKRQERFESTALGGLTSAQRKTIAARLRAEGKDVSDRRVWNKAVKAFKAENGFA